LKNNENDIHNLGTPKHHIFLQQWANQFRKILDIPVMLATLSELTDPKDGDL